MRKPQMLLIGAGGHARSCIDVIEQQDKFSVFGLIGNSSELGLKVLDYEVIGTDDDFEKIVKKVHFALVVVGQIREPQTRMMLFRRAVSAGFRMPSVVSPTAYVSKSAHVGAGSIVMHGATINSNVTIGDNCIVNSHALIEHDSQILDHCHISTGVVVNGGVTVDSGSFIGSRSVIREGLHLEEFSVVSMGSIVSRWPIDQDRDLGNNRE